MTSRHPPLSATVACDGWGVVDAGVVGAGAVVPEVGELAAVSDALDALVDATGAPADAVGDVAAVGPPFEQPAAASAIRMGARARTTSFTRPSSTR